MKTLAKDSKLTPEQEQAVKDLIAKAEKAAGDAAAKVQGEVRKTADDLKNSSSK